MLFLMFSSLLGLHSRGWAIQRHGREGMDRIIHGEVARRGQFPWMAALVLDGASFCGGSIISEDWILTAAHCVDKHTACSVTVGSLKSLSKSQEEPEQHFLSKEIYRHPLYNVHFYDNDIALVRLPSKIKFYPGAVEPVRLPSYTFALKSLVDETVYISGWGFTTEVVEGGTVSPDLLFANLTVAPDEECYKDYKSMMIPNKLCLRPLEGHSTCQGDSGGALVLKGDDELFTQVGLTSFGSQQGCTKGFHVVFTKITSFLDYIELVTRIKIHD